MSERRSMSIGPIVLVVGLISVVIVPAAVEAEPTDQLVLAEEAYDQVDFDAALTLATQAIESGQRSQSQLTRLYELVAVCAAALDRGAEARDAYTRMLALNPNAEVDGSLAPRIRTIFLEARGSWVTRRGRLSVDVTPLFERGALRVDLADPLSMGSTVQIRVRIGQDEGFSDHSEVASSHSYVVIPTLRGESRAEIIVRVLDEHGNHVVEVGTEDEPIIVGDESPPRVEPVVTEEPTPPEMPEPTPVTRRAWFWAVIGTAALVVVGGSVAAGVVVGNQQNSIGAETEVTMGVR